jgi:hypothetical protein
VAAGRDADELLVLALATGRTHAQAAAAANVSERTVNRRMSDPAFKARVRKARGAMVAAASGKLAANMTAAADALVLLLADADPTVRLRAATKLIELGVRTAELVDLEHRVQELEKATGTGDDDDDEFEDDDDDPDDADPEGDADGPVEGAGGPPVADERGGRPAAGGEAPAAAAP